MNLNIGSRAKTGHVTFADLKVGDIIRPGNKDFKGIVVYKDDHYLTVEYTEGQAYYKGTRWNYGPGSVDPYGWTIESQ